MQEQLASCRLLAATEALLALADPVLRHYEARKRSAGLLAYDDLIAIAQQVCATPVALGCCSSSMAGSTTCCGRGAGHQPGAMGHRPALTEEIFAGAGVERRNQAAERIRTVFAVGDIKQSIYGFQGADAAGFGTWEDSFRSRVTGIGGDFRRVQLNVSFRSTAPVLALVDAVFAEGEARAGVVPDGMVLEHRPDRAGHAGCVELWPLLRPAAKPKPLPWQVPERPERVADAPALLAEAWSRASRI